MWQRKTMIVLILVLVTLGTIGAVTLMPSTLIAFEHILLADWVEQLEFDPVILQPEPEDAPLKIGPLYSETLGYIEMAYIDVGDPNAPGESHSIFQSDSFGPFFVENGVLKMYRADRDDVAVKRLTLRLDNQDVEVEVRRNQQQPNRGVTLFVLGGTHVAHHWHYITEDEALMLLEQSVQLVTENDLELIEEFDQYLLQKRQS